MRHGPYALENVCHAELSRLPQEVAEPLFFAKHLLVPKLCNGRVQDSYLKVQNYGVRAYVLLLPV